MADAKDLQTRAKSVMEDPSAQAVARVYANAFLNAAASVGVEQTLEEFASFLDDVLESQPQFQSLLLSAIVNRDDKLGMIDRVVGPHGSPLFTSFLKTLANHDRLDLLPLILHESQLSYEKQAGRQRVQVASATPLSDSALDAIRQRLQERFSFEPIIEADTDPSLLGGLVIRVHNTVFDSSLKTRMKQFRAQLRERSVHEIQSGRDRFGHPEGD